MQNSMVLRGNIIDVVNERIYKGEINVVDGIIKSITEKTVDEDYFIIPGLIDSHIHIESSMLVPSEFAKIAVVHGTVATVSDPHEIANVLGVEGVEYMIKNSQTVPFKFYFGAPSCVPATSFESSGAVLGTQEISKLLQKDEIKYLSEMMNFPGVLFEDKEVMAKIQAAKLLNKPVDGHAPGLSGNDVKKYIQSGISTDHECFTIDEALEKISYGMKIQIREGSAAKNFDTLIPLLENHADDIMFCSDDRHPDDLLEGHMNTFVKRAIQLGYDALKVLRVCTYNPRNHYNLDNGLLQVGDPADIVIVDNLKDFNILSTYINGELAAKEGQSLIETEPGETPNLFLAKPITEEDLYIQPDGKQIQVIQAIEGELITKRLLATPKIMDGNVVSDIDNDILKMVVLNRYKEAKPAIGFIRGFGLKTGAIASTVAHDSHNIIAVGTSDSEIVKAVNQLIESKGGIIALNQNEVFHLPLPVAGIMSNENGKDVANLYKKLNETAKKLGTNLHAPFMTLSFMALLVIPELKLSDKGLFDGSKFEFVPLFE